MSGRDLVHRLRHWIGDTKADTLMDEAADEIVRLWEREVKFGHLTDVISRWSQRRLRVTHPDDRFQRGYNMARLDIAVLLGLNHPDGYAPIEQAKAELEAGTAE